MAKTTPTRRQVLLGSAAAASALSWPTGRPCEPPRRRQRVSPRSGWPEAARKEGKVIWYTSVDLQVAEIISKAFLEQSFLGIAVRVERGMGAERVFQRIGQETPSNIFACDVAQSSDAAHYIAWKREGILTPCLPEDVAKHFPAQHKDVDGLFASWRVWLCGIGLQYEAREGGRGTQELRRPARPQVDGQARQGASQLQRHDHDGDATDGSLTSAGPILKSSPSRR